MSDFYLVLQIRKEFLNIFENKNPPSGEFPKQSVEANQNFRVNIFTPIGG